MHPIYNIKFMVSLFCLIAVILSVILFLDTSDPKTTEHFTLKGPKTPKARAKPKPVPLLPERIVHIDLKGAPPRPQYFSKFFPLIKTLGATGVLLEYEDMFPYKGPLLKDVAAKNSYTISDVKLINKLAEANQLKVIPYIQTLGNLEFLLKLQQFVEYREVSDFPSTICPSFKNTSGVLEELIEQVLRLHPNSSMIHIGCNDVAFLGHCERCTNRMFTEEVSKTDLFLQHVDTVVHIIKRKRPGIKILIWDDQFRSGEAEDLVRRYWNRSFRPVVWGYGQDVYDELGPGLWKMYEEVFGSVWIASSFKGSTGSNKYISNVNHHIQNQKSWLNIVEEYHTKINFEGIILTGWQRYDHFATLCELLPVAIPTLAMSLQLLQGYKDSGLGPPLEVAAILECQQPYGLIGTAFGSPKCKFPGGDVLELMINFHELQQEFNELLEDSKVKGWLSPYNQKYAFSNPQQVESVSRPLDKLKEEVEFLEVKISHLFLGVYDEYTVNEWLETYWAPLAQQINSLWEAKTRILEKKSWSRRPLNYKEL